MINNTTIFINQTLNSTITNVTAFTIPTVRYIRFSDVSNVFDAVTFYKACVVVYPHIFIPVIVLSFIVSYYVINKVVNKYE